MFAVGLCEMVITLRTRPEGTSVPIFHVMNVNTKGKQGYILLRDQATR